jgi:hypothetical protein
LLFYFVKGYEGSSNSERGSSCQWSYGSWIYNYLYNQCLSPLMFWVRISIRARYTTLCDKVRQWLATCRWFSPEPTVSSTNKADRHDKTEILLKVALNTTKQTNSEMSHIWKEYLTSEIIKQDKSSKYYTLCVEQNTVFIYWFNTQLFNFPLSTCY